MRVLCPSERKTVQIHGLLSMVAWLRLRRPLAGERLGATAAIWHYNLLGHTRLTKLAYIVARGRFEWGKSVSGAHFTLHARESRCILLDQSID